MEGQGDFVLPPEDNYNLPLDPYEAGETILVFCVYNESGATPTYMYRKDGDSISPRLLGDQGIIIDVPNEVYTPSVEGTYTCIVTVNGQSRGSRDTIVRLPGKFCVQHLCVSYMYSQVVAIYHLKYVCWCT